MRSFLQSAGRRVFACFLTGLFAILPLVITVAIVVWVADFLHRMIGPNTFLGGGLRSIGATAATNLTLAYVFGWLIVLGVVFALGVVMEAGAKRMLQRLIDGVLGRVPVLGGVYNTSKQVVDMLDQKKKKEEANLKGMSPVFCFFGKEHGAAVLGLLVSPETFVIDGQPYQIVMVPTAPVPIGGGLFFVPATSIRPAELSAEGTMSIYVSMGASAGSFLKKAEPLPNPA
ncbi:MAG: DUF502 domain-containing protein [Planctomycetota bacterium]